MKLRTLFIATTTAIAFSASAFAADTLATVNIQQIMHDSTAAKSIKEQLDAKQKSFQDEMSKKEEVLRKEDQELAKERSVLAPDAFDKKVKEFKAKASAAQKDVQEKRTELDNAFSAALADIQKTVFDIVAGIAKDKGYTVVLPTSQLLYADPKLDITQDVLTKLNSTLPKVTVNFKDKPASGKDEE